MLWYSTEEPDDGRLSILCDYTNVAHDARGKLLDAAQDACGGIAPYALLYVALIVGSLCYHAMTYLMKIAPPG